MESAGELLLRVLAIALAAAELSEKGAEEGEPASGHCRVFDSSRLSSRPRSRRSSSRVSSRR